MMDQSYLASEIKRLKLEWNDWDKDYLVGGHTLNTLLSTLEEQIETITQLTLHCDHDGHLNCTKCGVSWTSGHEVNKKRSNV